MKQVASLRYGVIFKKAFSQPDIFKAFVKAVLGIELEIDKVETEKSFKPTVGYVDSRFDLFAQDDKNRIIVDIQHAQNADHYDRFLHYHCVALLEQIAKAKNYRPALKVFTIVVLTSGDRHQKDVLTIDFDPKDLQGNGVNEIPHKVLYLCPKYVNDNTPKAYREWLAAIQDTLDEEVDESHYHDAMIQKTFDSIEKDGITPTERAAMFEEYNQRELINAQVANIVKNLRAMGLDEHAIINATGLTSEDIAALNNL
ncbi:PD-(D/E)XK nuclease family transposase [Crenothrix sp.]|uniref:PD-(D/E)XK nuclease family transposase n=1 Tax=Crenothrix sp. TaxID=3100433 RepID=UPI00374CD5A4